MDSSHGWYCSRCGHWNSLYESYCYRCGSPRNYSYHPFFSHTITCSHTHVNTEEYKRNSSERSASDNSSKSSRKELTKLKKLLDLQIQLVYKAIEKKEAQNDLLNTLEKVKNKIQNIEESNGDYQKTLSLIGNLTSSLDKNNNPSDLTKIKSLQQSAEVEGRMSDYQELHEIIDLLTGTKILGTLDLDKTEESKSEEKKGEKDKKDKKDKKGEKDNNIPSDPQSLIEDISEQWEKGNFDSVQESLESLGNLEKTKEKKDLVENISDSKKDLKSLIEERKEIIKLINKIKSEKLKDKIKISEEKLTDDEILEELEGDDDD